MSRPPATGQTSPPPNLATGRYFCPVALPWFRFLHDDAGLNPIRRKIFLNRENVGRGRSPLRIASYALRWPVIATYKAWQGTRVAGRRLVARGGPSRLAQLGQMIYLALSNNFTANSYYRFGLWEREQRQHADAFLQGIESHQLLYQLHLKHDVSYLDDKTETFQRCDAAGLPTPPVLVELRKDAAPRWLAAATLPPEDLFIKPADLADGRGASRWLYAGIDQRWSNGKVSLKADELLAREHQSGGSNRLIVQPRVENHRDIQALSGISLCTLRVVTCRIPQQPSRFFRAMFRMPVGNVVTDNMETGGIAAPLLEHGRLGLARDLETQTFSHHPDTDARIEGIVLPGWRDMLALATRAHDTIGVDGIIGWDIAYSPNGAILIEGNPRGSLEGIQTVYGERLGETEFPELIRRLGFLD